MRKSGSESKDQSRVISYSKQQEEMKIQSLPESKTSFFKKRKYPPLVLLPQANDPLDALTAKELPPGITIEMAKDPSNPDFIFCLSVLKLLAEELEKAQISLVAEGRRKDNRIVADNWKKSLRKAMVYSEPQDI